MKLTNVLRVGSNKLLRWTEAFLLEMGYTDIHSKIPEATVTPIVTTTKYSTYKKKFADNFVYAEGNIPILLIAHVDTIHSTLPIEIYHDKEQQVMWSPDGLGADDRAGVYLIFKLLKAGYKPFVLFTDGEETGGDGAYAFCHYLEENFGTDQKITLGFNYMIQLDRRGNNEAVFYDEGNKDFIAYITQNFGFKETYGTFTDISILCPSIGVSGVNLSIGYEYNHTSREILHLDWLENTFRKVKKMLKNPSEETFTYQAKRKATGYGYSTWTHYDGSWRDYEEDYTAYKEESSVLYPHAEEEEENPCIWAMYDEELGYICTNNDVAGEMIACEMLCGSPEYCEKFIHIIRSW